ncbi:DUF3971 domain-containing protein [Aliiroseovarius sp. YM-037]|uniref:YhdP family protein n=1 Tax=Aliiroseovarius sp. YM-037 TaxID=3341728 RepID=UPI003A80DE5E
MSDETKKRKRRKGFGLWMLLSVALILLVGLIAGVALSGKQIEAPEWVRDRIERTLGDSLAGGQVAVGSIKLEIAPDWSPVVELNDVAFSDATNLPLAKFETLKVTLAARPILRGEVLPVAMRINGGSVALRREPDGRFDLALDTTGAGGGSAGSLAEVLDSIDTLFETPQLASIQSIRAEGVTFQYEDVRSARFWAATGGALELEQTAERLELRLGFQLLYGQETPAQAAFSFTSFKGSPRATLSVNVRDLPAADFSSQAPALAWLSVLRAPVSGAVRADIDDEGQLADMNGTLEIGAGAVQPTEQTRPIGFNSGRAYFAYDPTEERVTFNELSVSTDSGTLRADGKAYLRDVANGWPSALIGQFRFTQILTNPGGVLDDAVAFDGGALDLQLELDPFSLHLGQLVLFDGETNMRLSGDVLAADEGWAVALNLALDSISPARLKSFWPATLIPKTREWIVTNVTGGVFQQVSGAVRLAPKSEPVVSLGFAFDGATVRYMKTMPPITNGAGYATVDDESFALNVERGIVTAPSGGNVDVSDTVVQVPNVRLKPAPMKVGLRVRGPVPSVLSLLDEPPFEFLTKAGQPTDLASGTADVTADITFPLLARIDLPDISYDVAGTVRNVQSDTLVEGKLLRADSLDVRATPDGLSISGAGQLGAVPFRGAWRQEFGPEARGKSRVEGTVELSQTFVDEFSLGLPEGSVSGQAQGQIALDFERGAAPKFELTSDLQGLGMRLADLGWSKPAGSTGTLDVSGTIGRPPQVDQLTIVAAGLNASGAVTLNEDGTLNQARFSRVQVGRWLDAPVVLSGRGGTAAPAVSVEGGRIDIRQTRFGRAGGSGRGGPISLALDQLIVSEGITLTGLRGNFSKQPTFSGNFTARVNGEVPVAGTLAPQQGGTAIRIRSDDAGGVMRSAGIIDKAYGGALDLILIPRQEEGSYSGRLNAGPVRVRGAPALADLLGAISVIGLLEQLDGQGIVFNNVEADFRLTPRQAIITRSSAVGASLGVSMDGVFDLGTEQLNMQGVISPIYLVNGIGAALTRRGEGLFGFNFRLRGTSDNPQVSVNPLSILTPGMFREIFRRPAPQVRE